MAQTNVESNVKKSESKDLMQACIENCQNTQQSCMEAVNKCIEMGGEHAEPSHIRSLLTCVTTCRNSVELMAMNSDLANEFCRICAEACESCAESCSKMEEDFMQKCAELCKKSAESCRRMSHH